MYLKSAVSPLSLYLYDICSTHCQKCGIKLSKCYCIAVYFSFLSLLFLLLYMGAPVSGTEIFIIVSFLMDLPLYHYIINFFSSYCFYFKVFLGVPNSAFFFWQGLGGRGRKKYKHLLKTSFSILSFFLCL